MYRIWTGSHWQGWCAVHQTDSAEEAYRWANSGFVVTDASGGTFDLWELATTQHGEWKSSCR